MNIARVLFAEKVGHIIHEQKEKKKIIKLIHFEFDLTAEEDVASLAKRIS